MSTLKDIDDILDDYSLYHEDISSNMIRFGITPKKKDNIGYMSLTGDNQILCRIYYKTPTLSHANTFIFSQEQFSKELEMADQNFMLMYDKEIEETLNKPMPHIGNSEAL